jgi:hypothetical protein
MLPHPSGPPICVAIPLARHIKESPAEAGPVRSQRSAPLMGYASASVLKGAAERCLYRIDHRVQPRVSNLIQTVAALSAQSPLTGPFEAGVGIMCRCSSKVLSNVAHGRHAVRLRSA